MLSRTAKIVVATLVAWQFGLSALLTVAGADDPKLAALTKMLWGLNLLWIGGCGIASLRTRRRVAEIGAQLSPPQRWLAFFAGATLLILIEEAITTTMTNCGPLFGVALGEVYITASANYLDVILYHSAVAIVPQFALWGVLMARYDVSPFAAFLCYGLTGFLNEALFAGPNPLLLPQWVLVYGLLVYLPAHVYQQQADRRPVRWWFYPVLVVAPMLASLPVVALLLLVLAPGHPRIHFPPM